MFNQKDVLVRSIAVTTASTVSWPTLTNICLVLTSKHLELKNEPPASESVKFGIEHCNCMKEMKHNIKGKSAPKSKAYISTQCINSV